MIGGPPAQDIRPTYAPTEAEEYASSNGAVWVLGGLAAALLFVGYLGFIASSLPVLLLGGVAGAVLGVIDLVLYRRRKVAYLRDRKTQRAQEHEFGSEGYADYGSSEFSH